MISGMSWIDSDNSTSTEVVNKSTKIWFKYNKSYDNYSTNDSIRFTVLKFSVVQLSWGQDGTIIMGPGRYNYHGARTVQLS